MYVPFDKLMIIKVSLNVCHFSANTTITKKKEKILLHLNFIMLYYVTCRDLHKKVIQSEHGIKCNYSSVNLELTSSPGHPIEIKRLY